ncbi:MAG: hypothetical protein LBC41_04950 [Clostridiales bacterium]|jgi:hypothetical protein|nr:hypothetical protein [Clostridiales bacterium]MDR2749988.1 hypothetical protein [Clostridiales bacterium]
MNDWVERYTYAVARHLPLKTRSDVAKELDGLISDMLAERTDSEEPSEKDILAVLTELGAPDELAAKYSGDENRGLISGPYFLLYKRILKIVLPIIAASLAFAILVGTLIQWDKSLNTPSLLFSAFAKLLAELISCEFMAFGIVTLVFTVLEHLKIAFNTNDFITGLPSAPKERERIKPIEPISGMIFRVVIAALFLVFPDFAGVWIDGLGWVPAFNSSTLQDLWLLIILWTTFTILVDSFRLLEGQYTRTLAIVTLPCDFGIAITASIILLNKSLMNPVFIANIGDVFKVSGDPDNLVFFNNLHLVILGFVFFSLFLESTIAVSKALKKGLK